MKKFELASKIIWRKSANQDITSSFYPSFIKDIDKKEAFFQKNFIVEIMAADTINMNELFLPLYMGEVASREDFTLNKKTVANDLLKKVEGSSLYKLMVIHHDSALVSVMLFSLKDGGLHIGYRATKKNVSRNTNHKATVSYWGEKLIFQYGKECGVSFFSYGKDSHPFFGKNIGRPLYKLKTGMRPRAPIDTTTFSVISMKEKELAKTNGPVLFFDEPNQEGFYTQCHLYYSSDLVNDGYAKEFGAVLSWAGINLTVKKYQSL